MEGSLAELQAENAKLSEELVQKSESFEQEKKKIFANKIRSRS
jgi:hypothetical protein